MQEEAAAAMAAGGSSDGHTHGDVPNIYLEPGERGQLEVTFDEPGTLLLGCHVPGRWEAGMRGVLQIEA